MEALIMWCINNHLKLKISRDIELVIRYHASNVDVGVKKLHTNSSSHMFKQFSIWPNVKYPKVVMVFNIVKKCFFLTILCQTLADLGQFGCKSRHWGKVRHNYNLNLGFWLKMCFISHSDLDFWPQKQIHLFLIFKCTFVPNMKKFPQCVLEISC